MFNNRLNKVGIFGQPGCDISQTLRCMNNGENDRSCCKCLPDELGRNNWGGDEYVSRSCAKTACFSGRCIDDPNNDDDNNDDNDNENPSCSHNYECGNGYICKKNKGETNGVCIPRQPQPRPPQPKPPQPQVDEICVGNFIYRRTGRRCPGV